MMTDERRERNPKNSDRLNDIIVWSIQNHGLWLRFCHKDTDQGIKTHYLNAIIDQCLHQGFMEIYYIVLTKIADIVGIGIDLEQVTQFLAVCVDENLTLDMDRITKAIEQSSENANE